MITTIWITFKIYKEMILLEVPFTKINNIQLKIVKYLRNIFKIILHNKVLASKY